jgi:hypothetical protein
VGEAAAASRALGAVWRTLWRGRQDSTCVKIEPPLVSWWTSCSSMNCASRGTRIAMSLAIRNR